MGLVVGARWWGYLVGLVGARLGAFVGGGVGDSVGAVGNIVGSAVGLATTSASGPSESPSLAVVGQVCVCNSASIGSVAQAPGSKKPSSFHVGRKISAFGSGFTAGGGPSH